MTCRAGAKKIYEKAGLVPAGTNLINGGKSKATAIRQQPLLAAGLKPQSFTFGRKGCQAFLGGCQMLPAKEYFTLEMGCGKCIISENSGTSAV